MSVQDFSLIQSKLYKKLDTQRYQHTLGVMYTSGALAMVHGYDLKDAQLAGLLHDCAKCIPNHKKLKICRKHNIPVTKTEFENPFLLHAKLGAYLAHKKYGVDDKNILDAIRWHTTGRQGMTILEKIVFIADYIEPMRDKAPRLGEIRQLAFRDLDACMYAILKDTLEYLNETPSDVDQMTVHAFQYYETIQKNGNMQQMKGAVL